MNIFHHSVFPSIITETQCDLYHYIRKDLIEWIYEYQSVTDSVFLTNRGGWQSPADFFEQESFTEFKNYILNNAFQSLRHFNRKLEVDNMWININKKGNYNTAHNHPGCYISGVFWVKVPENSGNLVFTNPHSFDQYRLIQSATDWVKNNHNYHHTFEFKPHEGTLVMFPANLDHKVEPNQSDEDRISIAFNLQ
jgi:uncharacterized protein (TIGR02466 family)